VAASYPRQNSLDNISNTPSFVFPLGDSSMVQQKRDQMVTSNVGSQSTIMHTGTQVAHQSSLGTTDF
jgi:hypothetical protein